MGRKRRRKKLTNCGNGDFEWWVVLAWRKTRLLKGARWRDKKKTRRGGGVGSLLGFSGFNAGWNTIAATGDWSLGLCCVILSLTSAMAAVVALAGRWRSR
ncbi:hypothetical protein V6N13_149194 [Hibiscus sabdariffa]